MNWRLEVAIGSLRVPIAPLVAAIGAQARIAGSLGLYLGAILGGKAGLRASLAAGVALCAVAVWLALGALFGWAP